MNNQLLVHDKASNATRDVDKNDLKSDRSPTVV